MDEIRILGLDELDADELTETVPDHYLEVRSATADDAVDGAHHEPMTVLAVIALSSAAITGLSAWLLKKRHQKTVKIDYERRTASGDYERLKAEFELQESSTQPEVIEQLGRQIRIDPAAIADALAQLRA